MISRRGNQIDTYLQPDVGDTLSENEEVELEKARRVYLYQMQVAEGGEITEYEEGPLRTQKGQTP